MKTRTFIDLVDQVYIVEVRVENITQLELDKILAHGEPEIDIGGDFSGSITRPGGGSPVSVTFTLPHELHRIKSDFPVKMSFDTRDDVDADVKAKVWENTIEARISAARTTLLSQAENFIGEFVTNLP